MANAIAHTEYTLLRLCCKETNYCLKPGKAFEFNSIAALRWIVKDNSRNLSSTSFDDFFLSADRTNLRALGLAPYCLVVCFDRKSAKIQIAKWYNLYQSQRGQTKKEAALYSHDLYDLEVMVFQLDRL